MFLYFFRVQLGVCTFVRRSCMCNVYDSRCMNCINVSESTVRFTSRSEHVDTEKDAPDFTTSQHSVRYALQVMGISIEN